MTTRLQGAAIKSVQVDFGVSGLAGTAPTYIVMCHFVYDSSEAFEEAFMPHSETLMGDMANYTDIETIIQFSEVKI